MIHAARPSLRCRLKPVKRGRQRQPHVSRETRNIQSAEAVAGRIREAQERAALTGRELARAVGVTEQTVSAWRAKRGSTRPRDEHFARIAEALGVEEAWLRYGVGEASGTVLTGAPPPAPYRGMPNRAMVWLQEFLLELAKGGATHGEIESARALLVSEEAFAVYAGGVARQLEEEELLTEMQGLAEAIRRRLRLRGRKL